LWAIDFRFLFDFSFFRGCVQTQPLFFGIPSNLQPLFLCPSENMRRALWDFEDF